MSGFLIFLGAIAGMFGVVGAGVGGVHLARRRNVAQRWPITGGLMGARMSDDGPFDTATVCSQLGMLLGRWPPNEVGEGFAGLRITWLPDEDYREVEPTYQHPEARIPCKGATEVWQTGLAHEPAHHLLHPRTDHPAWVFSEQIGVVRQAREAMGMPTYPRRKL